MSHILYQGPVTLSGIGTIASDANRSLFIIDPTVGAAATGTINAIASALHVDGETFTLDDGEGDPTSVAIFEFYDGIGAPPANPIDITGSVTDVVMADRIAAAIVALVPGVTGPRITATSTGASKVVSLTNTRGGVTGNVAITDTVAAAGFTVTGMSGGNTACTLAAPTNLQAGMTLTWRITNNNGGTCTMNYSPVFRFPGGVNPTLTAIANATDVVVGICFDGTNLECSCTQDHKAAGT